MASNWALMAKFLAKRSLPFCPPPPGKSRTLCIEGGHFNVKSVGSFAASPHGPMAKIRSRAVHRRSSHAVINQEGVRLNDSWGEGSRAIPILCAFHILWPVPTQAERNRAPTSGGQLGPRGDQPRNSRDAPRGP